MKFDQLLQVTEIFLIANSILAVALADARNEKLKTALSLAGLLISSGWAASSISTCTEVVPNRTEVVITVLPILVGIAWLLSTGIHGYNWSQER